MIDTIDIIDFDQIVKITRAILSTIADLVQSPIRPIRLFCFPYSSLLKKPLTCILSSYTLQVNGKDI